MISLLFVVDLLPFKWQGALDDWSKSELFNGSLIVIGKTSHWHVVRFYELRTVGETWEGELAFGRRLKRGEVLEARFIRREGFLGHIFTWNLLLKVVVWRCKWSLCSWSAALSRTRYSTESSPESRASRAHLQAIILGVWYCSAIDGADGWISLIEGFHFKFVLLVYVLVRINFFLLSPFHSQVAMMLSPSSSCSDSSCGIFCSGCLIICEGSDTTEAYRAATNSSTILFCKLSFVQPCLEYFLRYEAVAFRGNHPLVWLLRNCVEFRVVVTWRWDWRLVLL